MQKWSSKSEPKRSTAKVTLKRFLISLSASPNPQNSSTKKQNLFLTRRFALRRTKIRSLLTGRPRGKISCFRGLSIRLEISRLWAVFRWGRKIKNRKKDFWRIWCLVSRKEDVEKWRGIFVCRRRRIWSLCYNHLNKELILTKVKKEA